MARRVRVEYPGAVYHVIARGNNRSQIFVTDGLRLRFLDTLGEACVQTGWVVHAYVLMRTHYHLLIETPEANLVAGMKWLQGTYTQRFNRARKQVGHLFQGRYKSLAVDPEEDGALARVSTYIHLNPFRAGVCGVGCADPLESYRWSSYPWYLKPSGVRPAWLSVGRVLESVGIGGGEKRHRERYGAWMEKRMGWEVDPVNAEQAQAEQGSMRRGWCIGGDGFREWVLKQMEAEGDNLRGEQRREHGEQAAERLLAAALRRWRISEEEVCARKSTDSEKQALAWLLARHTTATCTWVAGRLRMGHRSNVSRAVQRMETATDRRMQRLRREMRQCTG